MEVIADTQQAYDQWSLVYDQNVNPTRDLEGVALRQVLQTISFQSVLELGSGTGKNTEFIARMDTREIDCVDLSLEMLSWAQRKLREARDPQTQRARRGAGQTEDTSMKTEDTSMKTEDTSMKTEDTSMKTEDTSMKTEDTSMKTEDTTVHTEDTTVHTEDTILCNGGVEDAIEDGLKDKLKSSLETERCDGSKLKIRYFHCGMEDYLGQVKRTYDLVVCSLVLEHVRDLAPVFRLVAQVLSVGGHFYIGKL
jgi:SAM-dependent methyltransferase